MAIFFEIISMKPPPSCSILAKRKAACMNYTPPDGKSFFTDYLTTYFLPLKR